MPDTRSATIRNRYPTKALLQSQKDWDNFGRLTINGWASSKGMEDETAPQNAGDRVRHVPTFK